MSADGLMTLAAVRYCIGRRTYIVDACCRWLPTVWSELDSHTQDIILRDITEELMRGTAGDQCDVNNWTAVLEKLYRPLPDERKEAVRRMVSWMEADGKRWPLGDAALAAKEKLADGMR